jgi:hypothetical protein
MPIRPSVPGSESLNQDYVEEEGEFESTFGAQRTISTKRSRAAASSAISSMRQINDSQVGLSLPSLLLAESTSISLASQNTPGKVLKWPSGLTIEHLKWKILQDILKMESQIIWNCIKVDQDATYERYKVISIYGRIVLRQTGYILWTKICKPIIFLHFTAYFWLFGPPCASWGFPVFCPISGD